MLDPSPWLTLLGHQSLALSLGVVLLLLLRRALLLHFGPTLRYAAWALLPLLLLAAALPTSPPVLALKADVIARFEPLKAAMPAPALVPSQPGWPWLLAGLWAAGAATGLLRLMQLQRRYQRGLRLENGRWQSRAGSGPALVGLLRPRLALPADFEQRFDARQRELVLEHEAVHRSRCDNHWNALGALICLVHWFNPLAWLALRCMRVDQELSCDAAVMARHPGCEAAYGHALVLAQGPMPAGLPWAGWSSPHPLVERIDMLKLPPHGRGRRAMGLLMLAGLALAGAGAVQALGANPAVAATAPQVELKLELSYEFGNGSDRKTYSAKPTLRVPLGQRATVMLNGSPNQPSPEQIAIDIETKDLGNGKIQLQTEFRRGEPLVTVWRPRLITSNGVKAMIEQGRGVPLAGESRAGPAPRSGTESGRDAPMVPEHLSITITPTLLAQAKP